MDANVVRTLNEGPMGPQGPVKVNNCIMNNKAGFTPVVRVYNLENFMPKEVGPIGGNDITGNDDDDNEGDDVVTGDGTDTITTGDGTDTVTGGEGSDTTPGGEYNEDNGEETLPDIDNEFGGE